MTHQIIFATGNPHKVSEVQALLEVEMVRILSLKDVGFTDEIDETGSTFQENAWIKANAVYKKLQQPVIAEDSGLEVPALGGEPGVISARYAGIHGDAQANMDLLLERMTDISDRRAVFRSVLAGIIDGERIQFEGKVSGRIDCIKTGTGGFGYDPVFIPEGYNHSFGILDADIKKMISHRARAFAPFNDWLKSHYR